MSEAFSLFDLPTAPFSPVRLHHEGRYELRDFQLEDADLTEQNLREGRRAILVRHATGLGKSVLLSELAMRRAKHGRVIITVDVGTLAKDLARSVTYHTGEPCGVLTGDMKEKLDAPIIVSTVQTLYAKCRVTGSKRYERTFNPSEPFTLLVDECESAIAEQYLAVCRYFLDGNPKNVLVGTTATPMRGDGRGLIELFDYAESAPGPLNRDILWGCDNGWLVRPRQAFVRVNVDFSTLKLTKNEDGEKDYRDEDLGRLLMDEQALKEAAIGIHRVAKGESSIVICPVVDVAEKLAFHLCAERPECAHAVSGRHKFHSLNLIEEFKRGEFPYLTSVNMLYKGFDADVCRNVFMFRKTRSRRLYEQSLGRGTRPLKEIREALASAPDAESRRAIILESAKPYMTVVDLVGLNESAKDLGVIDILGEAIPLEARERAKRKMIDDADDESIDAEEKGREAQAELAEAELRRQARERKLRQRIQVDAQVDVEYSDNLTKSSNAKHSLTRGPDRIIANLKRFGVSDKELSRWNEATMKAVNGQIMHHIKNGLVTWKQAKCLSRMGYTKDQLAVMPKSQASAILDAKFGKREVVNA